MLAKGDSNGSSLWERNYTFTDTVTGNTKPCEAKRLISMPNGNFLSLAEVWIGMIMKVLFSHIQIQMASSSGGKNTGISMAARKLLICALSDSGFAVLSVRVSMAIRLCISTL